MKLLQKREIDTSKAKERKMEIDQGMSLARTVDKLRETIATEEKRLMDYRNGAIKIVQVEINQLIEERDRLKEEIRELLSVN